MLRLALLSTTLICLLCVVTGASAAASPPGPTVEAQQTVLLRTMIDAHADRASDADTRYFADGVWHSEQETSCWTCQAAMGTASAVAWSETKAERYRSLAIQTMERAIQRQTASGAFPNAANGASAIDTVFLGQDLAAAYLTLEPSMDRSSRARWKTSLARAADYLIIGGHDRWYINGNINAGITSFLYLTWRATAQDAYRRAYERSLAFVTSPPRPEWAGYGLVLSKPSFLPDGRDGAGYLTESASGGVPGFDAEYTEIALDALTRLYVASRDSRVLRLLNLLVNQELPLVTPTWLLSTEYGTRHPEPGRLVPFTTAAVPTLAWLGGRSDLEQAAMESLPYRESEFLKTTRYTNSVFYRYVSTQLSVLVLAADAANETATD